MNNQGKKRFNFSILEHFKNHTDKNTVEDEKSKNRKNNNSNSQPERIIALLGGRENIILIDACTTRLRVTVKNPDLVAEMVAWKAENVRGLIKNDKEIQVVYGPKADVLKSEINNIL